ncbi:hypothetical protein ACFQH2_14180 [Natronoarchaeum sp. GCM10025703]|uniref:hypothetical protein n=1 Tax=Natronoarchaeum sp. GCM10025703 TaxID=3252685 RepID=UPI00361ED270
MTGTVFALLGGRDRIGTTTAAASVAGSMAETATRVAVVDATFAGSGVQDVLDLPEGERASETYCAAMPASTRR